MGEWRKLEERSEEITQATAESQRRNTGESSDMDDSHKS